MQRLQGNVQYKDRKDIVCSYGVMDDGTNYFFIGEPLSNGNIIATTDLKEAIDPMEPASHIGVIDPDGKVIIPLENRKIKTLSDDVTDILVVERAVPTTKSVIDANNKKNDPSEATTIVSTQSIIKDKVNALIGPEGRFAANNPFGEASIYDLNGNNLANGEYYSYLAYGNGKVYMATNVENAEISEYAVLPPEVQANVGVAAPAEGAIDVNAVADNSEAIAETINTEMANAAEDITATTVENAVVETEGIAPGEATVDANSAVPPIVGEEENVVVDGIAPVEEAKAEEGTAETTEVATQETAETEAVAEAVVPEENIEVPAVEGVVPEEVATETSEEVVTEETEKAPEENIEVPAVEGVVPEEVATETSEEVVTEETEKAPEENIEVPAVEGVVPEEVATETSEEVVTEETEKAPEENIEVPAVEGVVPEEVATETSEEVATEETAEEIMPPVGGMTPDEIVAAAQAQDAEEAQAEAQPVEEVKDDAEEAIVAPEATEEVVPEVEAVAEEAIVPEVKEEVEEQVAEVPAAVEINSEEVADVTEPVEKVKEEAVNVNQLDDVFDEAPLQEEAPTNEEVEEIKEEVPEEEVVEEKPVNLVDLVDDDYYQPKEFKADTITIDEDMNEYGSSFDGFDNGESMIENIKAGVEKTYADNVRLREAVQVVKKKLEDEHNENLRLREMLEKRNGLVEQLKDNQDMLVSKCKELQAELRNTKSQLNGLAELSQLVESRSDNYVRTGRRSSGYDIDDIISSGRGRRAA